MPLRRVAQLYRWLNRLRRQAFSAGRTERRGRGARPADSFCQGVFHLSA
jgi:hypothetical protein